MPVYEGACHCGAVRWRVTGAPTEMTECDCSLCRKKNARMVALPASDFEMLSDWSTVTEYRWNTGVARHFFCSTCGIYTFHRKRSNPSLMGFNVACIENADFDDLPVRQATGSTMSVVEPGG